MWVRCIYLTTLFLLPSLQAWSLSSFRHLYGFFLRSTSPSSFSYLTSPATSRSEWKRIPCMTCLKHYEFRWGTVSTCFPLPMTLSSFETGRGSEQRSWERRVRVSCKLNLERMHEPHLEHSLKVVSHKRNLPNIVCRSRERAPPSWSALQLMSLKKPTVFTSMTVTRSRRKRSKRQWIRWRPQSSPPYMKPVSLLLDQK